MASKYLQHYTCPDGFEELLHDYIKEVLRNQPLDLIEFSALYFKCVQEEQVLDYPRRGENIPCDFKPTVPRLTNKKKKIEIEYNKEDYEKKIEAYEKNKMTIERNLKTKTIEQNLNND